MENGFQLTNGLAYQKLSKFTPDIRLAPFFPNIMSVGKDKVLYKEPELFKVLNQVYCQRTTVYNCYIYIYIYIYIHMHVCVCVWVGGFGG